MTGLTDDILSNSAEKAPNLLNINTLYPPHNSLIFNYLSKIFQQSIYFVVFLVCPSSWERWHIITMVDTAKTAKLK